MQENSVDFRAPPPSPVGSGRQSSVTNGNILAQFLDNSLKVPDLILPDKIFPVHKFIGNPPTIDFQSLSCSKNDLASKVLDSIDQVGCFQLVNHGIPLELIQCFFTSAAGIFHLSSEKRVAVTRSTEKPYGFEEVHGEEEHEMNEEFLWSTHKNLKIDMEGIWPLGYSNFSEKMETLVSKLEYIANKVLISLKHNLQQELKFGDEKKTMIPRQKSIDSICYLYKHKCKISDDETSNLLRYDVIKMLIRGMDYSHALCLHLCYGSSEFHVYSKKGWIAFCPESNALIITIGDQFQALSGKQYRHVIGRPVYKKGEKEDWISVALLYDTPRARSIITNPDSQEKTISIAQQAMFVLFSILVCRFLSFLYNKF